MAEGFSFSPDSNWQREFEDAFEFTETKDQLSAAKEIKRDMESPHPMDRLLCGDVGFGKTEVAMRAAFKALGDGKQVAVLAPTTVLAFQHFETFKRRFAAFPVRIEMFSRFRSAKEIKASVEELAEGKIDIAIGTHRLLSKDVEFRDLGLLIVDEEQRFGVRHKERLKQMRKNVDVLTMSATPIPRTLHMSLLGIRDMSVIETPPKDRLAIHTVVAHFDTGADPHRHRTGDEPRRAGLFRSQPRRFDLFARGVDSGTGAELPHRRGPRPDGRGGTGARPARLHAPRIRRVRVHHHRRKRAGYSAREHHHHRERRALRPLGAVPAARTRGPSNRRAYAYLLVPQDTELSEIARKRLAALREFSDLGAGFKIAALDLELRGAGNLLGGEQHGHIAAVGFDMYLRLLEETVQELKGEETPLEVHSALNLGLDIRIPPEYIADEHQRLRAYKRIADAQDAEQAETVAGRTGGPLRAAAGGRRDSAALRAAENAGGKSWASKPSTAAAARLQIKFHPGSKIDPARLMALVSSQEGAQFTPAGVLRLPMPSGGENTVILEFLQASLETLAPAATYN